MQGRRTRITAWIRQQVGGHRSVHLSDYSSYYSQAALQGCPQETLQKLTKVDLGAIKNYWFYLGQVAGIHDMLIARTGYSSEDGFRVYIPSDEATAEKMYGNAAMEAGAGSASGRAGWGRAIPLRHQAGMSLYGHEISGGDLGSLLEAGLDRWLKMDKGDFIGREALEAVQASGG